MHFMGVKRERERERERESCVVLCPEPIRYLAGTYDGLSALRNI